MKSRATMTAEWGLQTHKNTAFSVPVTIIFGVHQKFQGVLQHPWLLGARSYNSLKRFRVHNGET